MKQVRLTLDARYVYLEDAPLSLVTLLGAATSYLVKGHEHSPAFQGGYWDGRKKLLQVMRDGRVRAPLGLAQEIVDIVRARRPKNADVSDQRKLPGYRIEMNDVWEKLRPYQRDAVRAATTARGSLKLVGRGIVKMPPRSGKTLTSASIIAKLGVRTLFVVPSRSLLHQARRALREALEVDVGIAGDGQYEKRDVTVATVQTLSEWRNKGTKKDPPRAEYIELLREADCVIFDECHHLEAEKWRLVMQDSAAAFKIGLSATAFLDRQSECELGVIWLRACTGDMLIDISVSDLIEQGYLVRPDVRVIPIRTPDLGKRGWSNKLYRAALVLNPDRNRRIVEETRSLVRDGMKPVVISNRLVQVDELCRLMQLVGLRFARVVGENSQDQRERAIRDLVEGRIDVLIGTIFGEGIDIPEVDAIVNAEGGAGVKATYQRLRCLTPHRGKTRAVVVDFVDLTHAYFAKHSLERLAVYRNERAFRVRVAH